MLVYKMLGDDRIKRCYGLTVMRWSRTFLRFVHFTAWSKVTNLPKTSPSLLPNWNSNVLLLPCSRGRFWNSDLPSFSVAQYLAGVQSLLWQKHMDYVLQDGGGRSSPPLECEVPVKAVRSCYCCSSSLFGSSTKPFCISTRPSIYDGQNLRCSFQNKLPHCSTLA